MILLSVNVDKDTKEEYPIVLIDSVLFHKPNLRFKTYNEAFTSAITMARKLNCDLTVRAEVLQLR